jgi:hypothetical protein
MNFRCIKRYKNKPQPDPIAINQFTMETKKLITIGAILLTSLGLVLTGCKKTNDSELPSDTTMLQQLTNDENNVTAVSDEAMDDANNVLSADHTKSSNNLWPCNATIDSMNVANDTIIYYITYNGYNCKETRYRTGQVQVRKKVGTHWYEAGATVKVTLINFQVTRKSSQKTVTLNGTKTFENVSGGLITQLGYGVTSVTHKITGTVQATFENNTTKTWNIARQRIFTGTFGSNNQLVMTVDGIGSADGYENLVMWGLNRQGRQFYTQINTSVVYREACDWNPCSGVEVYQIPSTHEKATVTYGFDNNNQPITGNECPSRFRVDWEKNNHSGTFFLPLY